MNEIEICVKGKIYRLTNLNNNYKYDRAKKDAGLNAKPEQILAHYNKLAGYIQDENGNKINNDLFWQKEKKRLEKKQKRKEFWEKIKNITSHPVISWLLIILISATIYYFLKIDLSRFN